MAGRGPQSFKKKQKEQQRREKREEKIAKRLERKRLGAAGLTEPDDSALANDAAPADPDAELPRSASLD